jgi:hypothetical protein
MSYHHPPSPPSMDVFLFRYGIDILIICLFVWIFVKSARTGVKKRRRITLLLTRVVPFLLVSYLFLALAIPGVFGTFSLYARYLPQVLEAHKLRLYYQVVCIIPGVKSSELEIQRAINETAKEYTMHPDLIRAVIRVESSNNQFALSWLGACGLMQLMPDTFYSLQRGNPFGVRSNLTAGTLYLRQLYRRFNGNIELALAAYHAGPGVVINHGAVPPGAARRYVDRVMGWYKKYCMRLTSQDT